MARPLGDRRGRVRFEIVGQLWGSLETVEPLQVRNVGRGGVLLETRMPLSTQSLHRVRVVFPSHASDCQVRVRHVTPISSPDGVERYLVGVEFLELPQAALEQIDRLVTASGGRAWSDA